jgi:hypothetical protein
MSGQVDNHLIVEIILFDAAVLNAAIKEFAFDRRQYINNAMYVSSKHRITIEFGISWRTKQIFLL